MELSSLNYNTYGLLDKISSLMLMNALNFLSVDFFVLTLYTLYILKTRLC